MKADSHLFHPWFNIPLTAENCAAKLQFIPPSTKRARSCQSLYFSCDRLRSSVSSSNVKHVNSALFDSEEYSITTDDHLPNFFDELIIFRRKRKAFRHDAELFRNCRS